MSASRPSIRTLLFGANAAVVVLPLLAIAGLRVYDIYLLRQTERELIVESVMIGEIFREAYARERGLPAGDHRPTAQSGERYVRIEPVLDLGLTVLPPQPTNLPRATVRDSWAQRAGAAIEPLLRRAQTFNLSAIRVLDADGCVVATTRSEAQECMPGFPEVQGALAGRYTAVARSRVSDEPAPPIGDIRRRGTERVFTALPVFVDGRVVAVIRASRTGLDALSTLSSFSLAASIDLLLQLNAAPGGVRQRGERGIEAGVQNTEPYGSVFEPRRGGMQGGARCATPPETRPHHWAC